MRISKVFDTCVHQASAHSVPPSAVENIQTRNQSPCIGSQSKVIHALILATTIMFGLVVRVGVASSPLVVFVCMRVSE